MEGRPIVREAHPRPTASTSRTSPPRWSRCRRASRRCGRARATTRASSGAWRSTSTPAPAATPASSPARARTTSPSSATSRCAAAARCTGSASTATSPATPDDAGDGVPADALPAVRERPLRAGLPGGGDRAHRRRPERDGLQPLHRHPLLLEQLPVQGAALQLLQLHQGHARAGQDGGQPGRHRALARRDGEVHLLRAAHPGARASTPRWPSAPFTRRRRPHRLPADLPDPRRSPSATSAIPRAQVNERKAHSRNYVLLAELGNKPRTSYLARIRNPHPDLLDKPGEA